MCRPGPPEREQQIWELVTTLLSGAARTSSGRDDRKLPTSTSRRGQRGAKGKWYDGHAVELAVGQLRPSAKDPGRNKAAQNAHRG
jgi:hypothetical protein